MQKTLMSACKHVNMSRGAGVVQESDDEWAEYRNGGNPDATRARGSSSRPNAAKKYKEEVCAFVFACVRAGGCAGARAGTGSVYQKIDQ